MATAATFFFLIKKKKHLIQVTGAAALLTISNSTINLSKSKLSVALAHHLQLNNQSNRRAKLS
jgi:hypothetical protein